MNTREQLIDFHRRLCSYVYAGSTLEIKPADAKLMEKLIAERPYAPGDEIQIKVREEDAWTPATFIAVDPDDDEYIIYRPLGTRPVVTEWRCRFHRPIPKTRRLKPVPEEIIELAQSIHEHGKWVPAGADKVFSFLANPDNWEADDE